MQSNSVPTRSDGGLHHPQGMFTLQAKTPRDKKNCLIAHTSQKSTQYVTANHKIASRGYF